MEECWSELFLLNAVQWCLPLENNPLFNPSDHVAAIPNGKASQVAADIRVLNETLRRFRTISVDPAEFACMKAIVLFRAGKGDKTPFNTHNFRRGWVRGRIVFMYSFVKGRPDSKVFLGQSETRITVFPLIIESKDENERFRLVSEFQKHRLFENSSRGFFDVGNSCAYIFNVLKFSRVSRVFDQTSIGKKTNTNTNG